MAVAAPEATLSSELSLGLEFLDEEQLDTASWLLGESTFDLLLGGQSQQPIQTEQHSVPAVKEEWGGLDRANGAATQGISAAQRPMSTSRPWPGFPSALFDNQQDRQFGASFDIPDHSRPPPAMPGWQNPAPGSSPPHAAAQTPSATLPTPPLFSWQLDQQGQEDGKGRTEMDTTSHSPPKSESGESNGLDIPIVSTTNAHSSSPPGGKSSSWQRSGVLKRNRAKPRARAQVAQVAELKGKVAELTAKCSTMERALSQQTLGQTGSPVGASPLKGRQLQIKTKPSGQGSGLLDGGDARALPLSPPAASPSAHTPATPESAGGRAPSVPESLVGMSYEQFGNLYRSQVSKLAVKLGTLPLHKGDSNAIEELKQASSEVLLLVMRCCMENSVAAKMWMQESFKAEQARLEAEKDGGQFWQSTAASLALTDEQKQAVVRLRQAFLHRLDALQKARHAIIQGLTGSAPSSFRNRASAVAQLGALQKIEAYVANMKECDRLICDFVSSLLSQILTPIQMARCLVAAYPHWPDTLAISTYIAAAAGESSAIGMLRQEFAGVSIGLAASS